VSTAETLDLTAAQAPALVTEIPGPQARARIERDRKVTSPSLPRAYPFVPQTSVSASSPPRCGCHHPDSTTLATPSFHVINRTPSSSTV